MRILIIPSWYPTPSNPVNGIFVRQQAEGLGKTHDVRVLYLDVLPRGERRLLPLVAKIIVRRGRSKATAHPAGTATWQWITSGSNLRRRFMKARSMYHRYVNCQIRGRFGTSTISSSVKKCVLRFSTRRSSSGSLIFSG